MKSVINHYRLVTGSLFIGYGYLLWSIFPLLLRANIANLRQSSHILCGFKHTHSLVSFQWSGLSDQRMLLTETCLQFQNCAH